MNTKLVCLFFPKQANYINFFNDVLSILAHKVRRFQDVVRWLLSGSTRKLNEGKLHLTVTKEMQ